MEKRDMKDKPLEEILHECAMMRGVQNVQHRILREFGWFVNECVFGELREKYRSRMKFINNTGPDALQKWGILFYDYYLEEYGD